MPVRVHHNLRRRTTRFIFGQGCRSTRRTCVGCLLCEEVLRMGWNLHNCRLRKRKEFLQALGYFDRFRTGPPDSIGARQSRPEGSRAAWPALLLCAALSAPLIALGIPHAGKIARVAARWRRKQRARKIRASVGKLAPGRNAIRRWRLHLMADGKPTPMVSTRLAETAGNKSVNCGRRSDGVAPNGASTSDQLCLGVYRPRISESLFRSGKSERANTRTIVMSEGGAAGDCRLSSGLNAPPWCAENFLNRLCPGGPIRGGMKMAAAAKDDQRQLRPHSLHGRIEGRASAIVGTLNRRRSRPITAGFLKARDFPDR